MNLFVESITVLTNVTVTDTVMLRLRLPGALANYAAQPLEVEFHATHGYGVDYCRTHFPGVSVTLIDGKSGTSKAV